MDANQDAIESLLTGSPATLTALQRKIELLSVLTDQREHLNAKFTMTTLSDDTSTTTTTSEALSLKQDSQQYLQPATPSQRIPSLAMKTPGLDIPTPVHARLNFDRAERLEKFFDTYESLYDGVEVALELPPTHSKGPVDYFHDTDYVPVDLGTNFTPVQAGKENFHAVTNVQKIMSRSLISPQIQAMIDAAKNEGFEQAKQQLEQKITERVQREAQKKLEEHGAAWIKEHEQEVEKLHSQMSEMVEMRNAQELISKTQSNTLSEFSTHDLIDKHDAIVNDLQKDIIAMKVGSETDHKFFTGRILDLEREVFSTNRDVQIARDDLRARDDCLKTLIEDENKKQTDLIKTYDDQIYFLNSEVERFKIVDVEKNAEVEALMSQITTGNQSHSEALISERKGFQEKIDQLEELLSRSREMNKAAQANIEIEHAKQLEMAKMTGEEALRSLSTTCDQEKERWCSEIKILELRLSSLASAHSKEIDKIKVSHDVEVNVLNSDQEKRFEDLQDVLKLERNEALNRLRESSSREKHLIEKVSQLETDTEQARMNSQLREQELSKEHATEIDELISQLDLVEAESKKESNILEATMKQKDAIVAALGTQLAEASSRINKLDADHQTVVDTLTAAKCQAHQTEIKCATLVTEIERLKMENTNAMEQEKQKRNEACEKVRAEMITRAEEQFAKANVEYLRVKTEFEATVTKLGRIERELRVLSTKFEATKKEQATKEITMAAELAQSKAGEYFSSRLPSFNIRHFILSSHAALSS